MESAALEDYKDKDIGESRDFTAKLYNQEDVPQPQGVSYEAGPSKPGVIGKEHYINILFITIITLPGPAKPRLVKEKKVDPMKAVTGDAPDKWDKVTSRLSSCRILADSNMDQFHSLFARTTWRRWRLPSCLRSSQSWLPGAALSGTSLGSLW